MRPQGLPFRQCAARCWLSVTAAVAAATPSPVTAAPASTAPAAVAPTTMPTTIPASPAPATAPPAADGDANWPAPIRVSVIIGVVRVPRVIRRIGIVRIGVIWIGVRIVLRCGRPRHRSKRKRGRRENCPGKGDAPKPALLGANGHYYLQLVG